MHGVAFVVTVAIAWLGLASPATEPTEPTDPEAFGGDTWRPSTREALNGLFSTQPDTPPEPKHTGLVALVKETGADFVAFGAAMGTAIGWTVVGRHGRDTFAVVPTPVRGGLALMLMRTAS